MSLPSPPPPPLPHPLSPSVWTRCGDRNEDGVRQGVGVGGGGSVISWAEVFLLLYWTVLIWSCSFLIFWKYKNVTHFLQRPLCSSNSGSWPKLQVRLPGVTGLDRIIIPDCSVSHEDKDTSVWLWTMVGMGRCSKKAPECSVTLYQYTAIRKQGYLH